MRFVFATHNEHKLEEIRAILAGASFEVVSLASLGAFDDPVEDGGTFEENALIKAKAAAKATGLPALADDSGLEIDYLDKAPGVRSARFMGEDTPYTVKNREILRLLQDVPEAERGARFVCAVAVCFENGESFTVRGTIEGRIAQAPVGANGFGYDPIFFSTEHGMTTASMPPELKNAVSHRGKALAAMRGRLEARVSP